MRAICVPVLRFTFPHQDALEKRLERIDAFAGLVATSPRAVRALGAALENRPELRRAWQKKQAFAVGPKTAEALRGEGLHPKGQESGSAASLGSVIAKKTPERPLLFLSGSRRRDTLPAGLSAAGVPFVEQEVYRTHTRTHLELSDSVPGDWLVFFSPSGLEAIRQSPGIDIAQYRLAAIGPTTAAALEQAGATVQAVAETPTPRALMAAIQRALT